MTPARRTSAALRALLVLVLALGALIAGPAAVAQPTQPADLDGLQLEVTAVGPTVLRPAGTVSVRATLTNDGPATVEDLSTRLQAYTPRLSSRTAVQAWATDQFGIRAGNRLLAEAALPAVRAGESVAISLEAPAEALGLSSDPSAWGPRGLTLEVIDRSYAQRAVARAFTVWDPRPEPDAETGAAGTALTVLVPFTAGPPDVASGLLPPDAIGELTGSEGRLTRVLAAASRPDVTWAVDPTVLASAAAPDESQDTGDTAAGDTDAGQDDPGTTVTGAPAPPPASAQAWLDDVRAAADGRDVVALPQSDPDLVGLAQAGTGELYTLAARQGRDTLADVLDSQVLRDVAWPGGGAADDESVRLAAEAGAGAIVLSAGSQPPLVEDDVTLSGRSTVRAGSDRVDGLLVDTELSTTLRDATQGWSTALAVSRLLAETAVVTRGSDDPPHLLLALPRDWDPDVRATRITLDALASAPWVTPARMDDLLDREPDDVERAPLRLTGPDRDDELPADGLRAAAGALASVEEISSALTRPEDLLTDLERSAVAATAVTWRQDLPRWRAALGVLQDQAAAATGAVHVLEGSAVNVVSAQADLPVTVANDLPQDVDAVVSVQPRSPRLVARGDVEVRVGAGSTRRVALPVRAVANGNTEVVVTVRAPGGALLGEPVTVPVRVRADWETRGMLVAGGALAAVLVVGLVRTIRRGGRRDDPVREGS